MISNKIVNQFLIILIILNVFAVILATVDIFYNHYKIYFDIFEKISVSIFTMEYLVRLYTCVKLEKYSHQFKGRLKYMLTFSAFHLLYQLID